MSMKLTVTFKGGRRRVLKFSRDFKTIDKNRKAMFVMDDWSVYIGYSDGEVDEEGNFGIFGTIHGIALPFNRMLGWCYETVERKTKK